MRAPSVDVVYGMRAFYTAPAPVAQPSRPAHRPVYGPAMGAPTLRRDRGMTAVAILAALLVAWLGVLLALRTPFRCDLYVWSESPFMTDMLKLAHGQPVYSAPSD